MAEIDDRDESLLDRFVDRALENQLQVDPSELPSHLQAEGAERIAILAATSRADIADDASFERIGHLLGVDRPGLVFMDGQSMKRRRMRLKLSLSDLVTSLDQAGHFVGRSEMVRWESMESVRIPQALAVTIAVLLDVPLADLESQSSEATAVTSFLDGPEFERVLRDWCAEYQRDVSTTRADVERQLVTAQFRAEDVTDAQLRLIVQQLLDGMV